MRCKNYSKCGNRTPSPQNKKCWRLWQLCGVCAAIEHPEKYSKMYVRKMITMRNHGVR